MTDVEKYTQSDRVIISYRSRIWYIIMIYTRRCDCGLKFSAYIVPQLTFCVALISCVLNLKAGYHTEIILTTWKTQQVQFLYRYCTCIVWLIYSAALNIECFQKYLTLFCLRAYFHVNLCWNRWTFS